MTHLCDEAEGFAAAAIDGFCDVHARLVRRVPGGVVRATAVPAGKVAVVVGGGGGHYPAFAGYVGPGMADAAVTGDVFASPATRAVRDVAMRAHQGGGILLAFGNYAGDVLNFGLAADRLRSEGVDVRVLAVADDVASAAPDERGKRRGVAGNVTVFKIAGAAAEAGCTIDQVEALARRTDARTRSLGVAFGGCTLPGGGGAAVQRAGRARRHRPRRAWRAGDRRGGDAVGRCARLDAGRAAAERGAGTSRDARRGAAQRARQHQARGAVRAVDERGGQAAGGRAHSGLAAGRRVHDEPRHGRLLAHPDLARRRA